MALPDLLPPSTVLLAAGALEAALLLSAFGFWLLDRRGRLARMRAAIGRRSSRGAGPTAARMAEDPSWRQGALKIMRAVTARISIMKDRQIQDTRLLLVSAGFRSQDAVVVFAFLKLVSPLACLGGVALWIYGLDPIGKGPMIDAGAVLAGALAGSMLPDLVLKNIRGKRLESIRKGLPDALDMLVICAEAGLASDAALKRVVAEISRTASVLGDELNQTALELSFLPDRRQALERLAERAPVPSVQAFVNTLIQAEKYGTPLARAFKVLAAESRAERMLRAEQKAGRLPATMTVPMMIFILPALFVVLIGPAVLDILDNFIGMGG
jgi:tight adherence protein C